MKAQTDLGLRILICAALDEPSQKRREAIADALQRFHHLRRLKSAQVVEVSAKRTRQAVEPKVVQDAFSRLVESGAMHVRSSRSSGMLSRWHFRRSAYDAEDHSGLASLSVSGWTKAAIQGQLNVLTPVEGVEFEAVGLDGRALTVFTHLPDAMKETAFVLMSPDHPDVESWAAGVADEGEANTGVLLQVSGVDTPVPLVVSERVNARFGPTAVLGIPARDQSDRELAEWLQARPQPLRLTMRVKKGEIRSALRFAATGDQLAVEPGTSIAAPSIEGAEKTAEGIASWFAAAVTAYGETGSGACRQVLVHGPGDAYWAMQARAIAKALRDASGDRENDCGEPFAAAVSCGPVALPEGQGSASSLAMATQRYGQETIRLAMLGGGRPDTDLLLDERALCRAKIRIDRLRAFAFERSDLAAGDGGIEYSDHPAPARLSYWRDTAIKRITSQLESFAFHRAIQSLERLAERIEDFERLSAGHLAEPKPQKAIQAAVSTWVELADPLLPELTSELRQATGWDAPEGWPRPLGPPAARTAT